LNINKKIIINDPVLGFISLQSGLVFDLIGHPYVQRLRRIKQLGLSNLVFPGANHTRFEHALGASFLMQQAIVSLQNKGHEISDEESEAATIAILLHDIGHGPFSHVLEKTILNIPHEELSLLFMEELNKQFNGRLNLAIRIFKNEYHKRFLFQLVSSQLDVDRLDYLERDSFFTGVTEGQVSVDRIIKMLNVWNGDLVVEKKGIYSVEKFLIARRLMYWQVYLHKTVVSAEFLLINVLKRAKDLTLAGQVLYASPSLSVFLKNHLDATGLKGGNKVENSLIFGFFALLDDNDIHESVKVWQTHPDPILSYLAKNLTNRNLFRVKISEKPFSSNKIIKLKGKIQNHFGVTEEEAEYFYINQELTNSAYSTDSENIRILSKSGRILDFRDASDINLSALSKIVRKFFLCFPKELDFN
jgi:uncharacterized protein